MRKEKFCLLTLWKKPNVSGRQANHRGWCKACQGWLYGWMCTSRVKSSSYMNNSETRRPHFRPACVLETGFRWYTQSVNMCNPHNAPLMQNRSGSSVVFSLWVHWIKQYCFLGIGTFSTVALLMAEKKLHDVSFQTKTGSWMLQSSHQYCCRYYYYISGHMHIKMLNL